MAAGLIFNLSTKRFPHFKQTEAKDCGPTCLKIISKHYGKSQNIQQLRELSETTREGSSLLGITEAAEQIGFRTLGVQLSLQTLKKAPMPSVLHWNQDHYVVLYKIDKQDIYISDPAHGLLTYKNDDFLTHWIGNNSSEKSEEGIALLLEPTAYFYHDRDEEDQEYGFTYLSKYLLRYRAFIMQLIIGLLVGSILQIAVPFLTQSVVDVGIKNQDIHFIYLIMFAQLGLFIGKASLEIIRSWILLHLSTRINISLVSDFFIKLMKLPISYFDVRMTGDLMQRIADHKRIEQLLTTSSLTTLFSLFNLGVFSLVLMFYDLSIFLIFTIGSMVYFAWILFFFKRRKSLDYRRFTQLSQEQSKVIELINGMQEIKLHNAERRMRWNWEFLQARLFKTATKSLTLEQLQSVGSNLINELKNMFITILAAKLVIDGQITLGMMLAISYIVGQLNAPIAQLITFLRSFQDAKISLERLAEIHNRGDEEPREQPEINKIDQGSSIELKKISFRYTGSPDMIIKDLSLTIPYQKVTAIVGSSGSGKTTLMKLLLRYYQVQTGEIQLGKKSINAYAQKAWRENSGVVMQEGYIFNDTIAANIAVGEDYIDKDKLAHAAWVSNIEEFIVHLPKGYNTKIGNEGTGLSTGQKQRLLIARAVYKNPQFLFFDEATSALDASNEKVIMKNLNEFFADRTAVIIAHRLSTVKNADQIVVLEGGQIVEKGDHVSLTQKRGKYFELVRNQLELGN